MLKRRIFEVFGIQLYRFHYDSKPKLVAAVDSFIGSFLFFTSFFVRKTWKPEIDVEISPELLTWVIHLKQSKLQKYVEKVNI